MALTTERVVPGIYRIIDENGYSIASIIKANRRTLPWTITYGGGTPGGWTQTLKAAVQRINDRREE